MSEKFEEPLSRIRGLASAQNFIILLVGCVFVLLLLCGCDKLNSKSVSSSRKDLGTLTFDSGGWSFDEEKNAYSHVFPFALSYDSERNTMTVTVPAGYVRAEEKDEAQFELKVAKDGRSNVYESGSAPVVVFMGERDITPYIQEGTITVGLPDGASVIDVQMVIRALKYNAHDNKKVFPADTKAIYLLGKQTMGLVGVSADDESSKGLLKQYGAVTKYDNKKPISDKALGVVMEGEAASYAVSEAAEAWMYAYKSKDANQGVLEAADSYGEYINGLLLTDETGTTLKTKADDNGHLLKGSYTRYLSDEFSKIDGLSDKIYEHGGDYFPEKLDFESKLTDPTEIMYYLTGDRKEAYSSSISKLWQIGICLDDPGEVLGSINLYTALTQNEDAKAGLILSDAQTGVDPALICAWIRTATATEMEK